MRILKFGMTLATILTLAFVAGCADEQEAPQEPVEPQPVEQPIEPPPPEDMQALRTTGPPRPISPLPPSLAPQHWSAGPS